MSYPNMTRVTCCDFVFVFISALLLLLCLCPVHAPLSRPISASKGIDELDIDELDIVEEDP
jgi:hypothetical protein